METMEANLVLHSAVQKAQNMAQKLRLCTHQVNNGHGEPIIDGFVEAPIFGHLKYFKK